jgi:predicted amidohydrolase
MSRNLLKSAADRSGGGSPWSTWSPMPSLAPIFAVEAAPGGETAAGLRLDGNGNRHVFGAWTQRVPVRPGAAYRLRVVFRCRGIENLHLHVTPYIAWRRGDLPDESCAADAIRHFRRDGDRVIGEDTFVAPGNCDAAEVRLLLRYAPQGVVWFDEVALTESEAKESRRVRIGTMRACPARPASHEEHLRFYSEQIDRLSGARPDLILLPEFSNTAALPQQRGEALRDAAETIPGPFCAMLAEKARAYDCYLCAGLLERDGDFAFNAAVIVDRRGNLVAKQRKVHPYWPEEPLGVSPGDTFEVFSLDFGVVGIMICYDSWWPESARLLALKGAEVILFPNAGYEEKILPARAIDNNVFVIASTLYSPAAIVNTRGELLAYSAVDNVLCAEIDLNDRPKCHPNAGGNLNPGPGGARWARNANSTRVDEEILRCLQTPDARRQAPEA